MHCSLPLLSTVLAAALACAADPALAPSPLAVQPGQVVATPPPEEVPAEADLVPWR